MRSSASCILWHIQQPYRILKPSTWAAATACICGILSKGRGL